MQRHAVSQRPREQQSETAKRFGISSYHQSQAIGTLATPARDTSPRACTRGRDCPSLPAPCPLDPRALQIPGRGNSTTHDPNKHPRPKRKTARLGCHQRLRASLSPSLKPLPAHQDSQVPKSPCSPAREFGALRSGGATPCILALGACFFIFFYWSPSGHCREYLQRAEEFDGKPGTPEGAEGPMANEAGPGRVVVRIQAWTSTCS